jgi:hypothetical protein
MDPGIQIIKSLAEERDYLHKQSLELQELYSNCRYAHPYLFWYKCYNYEERLKISKMKWNFVNETYKVYFANLPK